jgi:hypothetical protein
MYSQKDIDNCVLATALSVMDRAVEMMGEDFLPIDEWHKWLRDQASEIRAVAAFVANLDKGSVTATPFLIAISILLDITAQTDFAEKKGHVLPLLHMAGHLRRAVEIEDGKIPF